MKASKLVYKQVNFFSLKPDIATNLSGKSYLFPTPFTIRLAIISNIASRMGFDYLEKLFNEIKNLEIIITEPEKVVISKSIRKIQKPKRKKTSKEADETKSDDLDNNENGDLFNPAISSIEYVRWHGNLTIVAVTENSEIIKSLFETNYFGKRSGFVQCIELSEIDMNNTSPVSYGFPVFYKEMAEDSEINDFNYFSAVKKKTDIRTLKRIYLNMTPVYGNNNYLLFEKNKEISTPDKDSNKEHPLIQSENLFEDAL